MERLKRYNKQIVAFVSAFVVLVGGVLSTSFQSVASSEMNKGYVFDLNYAEPSTSDNQGYVCIFTQSSSGIYGVTTYFWNTLAVVSGQDSPAYGILTFSGNTFNFAIGGVTNSASGYYSITQIGDTGNWWNIKNSSSETLTVDFGSQGKTILGFHYKGNVGSCNTLSMNSFTVYFSSDSSAIYLRDVWDLIHATYYQNEEIISELETLYSLQSNRLSQVVSWLETINGNATLIDNKLYQLIQKGNEILEEERKQTTWLEKIWNSIQEFFNPSEEEKTDSEQFDSETTEKSDEIGGLVEESKTEKPDVEDMSNSIDSNLDMTSANEYGAVLLNITENEYILQMLLIVVTVAIIAYVLFGKR